MENLEVTEELADIGKKKAELLLMLVISSGMTSHDTTRAALVAQYKDLHERENYLLIDF